MGGAATTVKDAHCAGGLPKSCFGGGETVKVKKGESYFIPAGSGKYAVTGDCETRVTVV